MNDKDNNRLAAVEAILAETAKQIKQSQAASEQRSTEFEQEMKQLRVASEQRSAEFEQEMKQSRAASEQRSAEFEQEMKRSRVASEQRRAEFEQEMKQSQAASEKRRAEFEQEMKQSQAASEKRRAEFEQEMKQSQAASEKRRAEFEQEMKQRKAIVDFEVQKIHDSQAETDKKLAILIEQVTGISKSNGIVAEDYFFNSFQKDKLNFFGEKFDKAIRGKGNIVNDEYDFVLINGKTAGIVEVKYKARKEDIPKALKKVNTFRINFPEYQHHKIYLAIAAFSINITLENECKKQGIAVIKQEGDKVIVYDKNLKVF